MNLVFYRLSFSAINDTRKWFFVVVVVCYYC